MLEVYIIVIRSIHTYFFKLLELRFLTKSTLHSLILLNSEAKIFNTLFYSLIFLSFEKIFLTHCMFYSHLFF